METGDWRVQLSRGGLKSKKLDYRDRARFRGQSGHCATIADRLLMTQSDTSRLPITALQNAYSITSSARTRSVDKIANPRVLAARRRLGGHVPFDAWAQIAEKIRPTSHPAIAQPAPVKKPTQNQTPIW
jgi:hypothetical protein